MDNIIVQLVVIVEGNYKQTLVNFAIISLATLNWSNFKLLA